MKIALLTFVQFLVFFLVCAAASFAHPLNLHWAISHPTQTSIHFFVADGVVLAFGGYLLVLIGEAFAKKVYTAGLWTTVAFVLALAAGTPFGWVTSSLY